MGIAKRWRGDRVLYYRYAPPAEREGEFREDLLPDKPHPDCEPYERSVYYFWWAFLRKNEAYRSHYTAPKDDEIAHTFTRFGNVHDRTFLEWWRSPGCRLFCEPLERMVRVHDIESDGTVMLGGAANQVVVSFPKDGNLKRILAEIEMRLKGRVVEEEGPSQARYPVERSFTLVALHRRLKIWELRTADSERPFQDIAREVMTFSEYGDHPKQRSDAARRYFQEAQCLIKYAGKGRFPVYNEQQGSNVPGPPTRPFGRARAIRRDEVS